MRRPRLFGVFVLSAALTAGACSKSSSTTPVTPTPTATTETFSGTLTLNGAITFPFAVTTAGSANATLTALEPEEAVVLQEGGTGDFAVGETVYQGESADTFTASGVVYTWDPASRLLTLRSPSGSFATGVIAKGNDGGAQWNVESVSAPVIGIAMGTWSGTTCTIVLASDSAGIGSTLTGVVQGQGSLCARVSDVGKLPIPATFSLDVTHF